MISLMPIFDSCITFITDFRQPSSFHWYCCILILMLHYSCCISR
jgi:hypothetical protein